MIGYRDVCIASVMLVDACVLSFEPMLQARHRFELADSVASRGARLHLLLVGGNEIRRGSLLHRGDAAIFGSRCAFD